MSKLIIDNFFVKNYQELISEEEHREDLVDIYKTLSFLEENYSKDIDISSLIPYEVQLVGKGENKECVYVIKINSLRVLIAEYGDKLYILTLYDMKEESLKLKRGFFDEGTKIKKKATDKVFELV